MRILGLIPARGGSKGIPLKNIKTLGGRPLIAYTAESASHSKYINRTIVSTDSKKIIEKCNFLSLDVPFIRPKNISLDETPTLSVIKHAINELENIGESYDIICLLQPTSPFRSKNLIDIAIEKFLKEKTDSLLSVRIVPHQYNPHWVFEKNEDGYLKIASGDKKIISRRQDLPDTYFRDGAIYLLSKKTLLKDTLFGGKISYIINDFKYHINLDNYEDWAAAEKMVKNFNNL
jgi:CMP-N,N'-diacetyllegionaminic acid synthase